MEEKDYTVATASNNNKDTRRAPDFPDTIDIMGSKWKIKVMNINEHPDFDKKNYDGWCSYNEREIVVLNLLSCERDKNETELFIQEDMRSTLRHEIVHAMFYESGLSGSSTFLKMPWAKNEEMVDWIALQGEKIYKLWEKANCLSKTL